MYGERLLCQGLWGASVDRFRIWQEYQPYHIGSDQTIRKDIHSLFCSSYDFTVFCRLVFSLFLLVALMFLLFLVCPYFLHCLITIAIWLICLFNKIHFVDLLLLSLFVSYTWSSGLYFCTSCDLFIYSPVGSFVCVYSIWQGSGQRADDTSSTACRERLILVHTFYIGLQVPLPSPFAHTPRGLSDCLLSLLSSCVIFCLHCIHLSARLPQHSSRMLLQRLCVIYRYEGIGATFIFLLWILFTAH